MENLDTSVSAKFSQLWTCYLEFENVSRISGENLGDFLNKWKEKMSNAQSAGCNYSDALLACKLLERSNLNFKTFQSIITFIEDLEPDLLFSRVLTRLEGSITQENPQLDKAIVISSVFGQEENEDSPEIHEENEDLPEIYEENEDLPEIHKENEDLPEIHEENEDLPEIHEENEDLPEIHEENEDLPEIHKENEDLPEIHVKEEALLEIHDKWIEKSPDDAEIQSPEQIMHRADDLVQLNSDQLSCGKCKKSLDVLEDNTLSYDHVTGNMVCKDCDVSPSIFAKSRKEKKEDPRKKSRTCHVCGKTFSKPFLLRNHMLRHSKEKNFKCELCPSAYCNRGALKIHMQKHLENKLLNCPNCPKIFVCDFDLKMHVRNVHPIDGRFKCDKCNFKTKTQKLLDAHFTSFHSSLRPFKCSLCSRLFKERQSAVHHLSIIHNRFDNIEELIEENIKFLTEKNFKCEFCPAAYAYESYLKIHMKKHLENKSLKCPFCQKIYVCDFDLKAHLRQVHPIDGGFQCDKCNFKTNTKQRLDMHLRTHSSIHPFKCNLCGKSFRVRSSATRHLFLIHRKVYNKYDSTQELIVENMENLESSTSSMLQGPLATSPLLDNVETEGLVKIEDQSKEDPLNVSVLQLSEETIDFSRGPSSLGSSYEDMSQENEHSQKWFYSCDICGKFYLKEENFLRHCQQVHGPGVLQKKETLDVALSSSPIFDNVNNEDLVKVEDQSKKKPQEMSELQLSEQTTDFSGGSSLLSSSHEKSKTCQICGKSFLKPYMLQNHMVSHTKKKSFKCEFCPSAYRSKESLKIHMKKHLENKSLKCPNCRKIFVCDFDLKKHLRQIHPIDGKFKCPKCNHKTKTQQRLDLHIISFHSSHPFKCILCGRLFKAKEWAVRHVFRIHKRQLNEFDSIQELIGENRENLKTSTSSTLQGNISTSPILGNVENEGLVKVADQSKEEPQDNSELQLSEETSDFFGGSSSLGVSLENMSREDEPLQRMFYSCDSCGKFYQKEENFLRHCQQVHGPGVLQEKENLDVPLSTSPILDKVEDQSKEDPLNVSELQLSEQTADFSGGSSFCGSSHEISKTCEICGKSFPRPSKLQRHMTSHTKEKTFKCEFCPSVYCYEYSLKIHMKKHLANNSLKCPNCPKYFSCDLHLKQHLCQIHPIDGGFQCDENLETPTSTTFEGNISTSPLLNNVENEGLVKIEDQLTEDPLNVSELQLSEQTTDFSGGSSFSDSSHEISRTCEICGKSFSRSSELQRHITSHTKEKTFKCEFCPLVYRHEDSLKIHMQKHLENKSLKCEYCPKMFVCDFDLKQHLGQVHSIDGGFQCDENLETPTSTTFEGNISTSPLLNNVKNECLVKIEDQSKEEPQDDSEFQLSEQTTDFWGNSSFLGGSHDNVSRKNGSSQKLFFPCDICGKFYQKVENFLRHRIQVHGPGVL